MGNPANKLLRLGFGLYWAWVYLSFNSQQIVLLPNHLPSITVLHIASGFAGCASFAIAIAFQPHIKRILQTPAFLWGMAAATAFGTLFYSTSLVENAVVAITIGALLPGLATPWIALAWGVAYCSLDAKTSTRLSAGSFMIAGALFIPLANLPDPISGIVVAFLPFISVACLSFCAKDPDIERPGTRRAAALSSPCSELKAMASGAFSPQVVLGILLVMLVSGGLRTYSASYSPAVYSESSLMALAILLVGVVFLAYSAFISRTGLGLGALYRICLPLFAIAVVALTAFSTPNSAATYFIASVGSTIMDMLTWVLLIEIVRTSRFSPLLVFAVGRLAIHLGMALGETLALLATDAMSEFSVASVAILVIVSGFMFSDRDKTFAFDPVVESELALEGEREGSLESLESRVRKIADQHGLTPRETEVFTLWATGHGAKSIEKKLTLSTSTVRTHVRHIYEKCGTHSRAELISMVEEAIGKDGV